MGLELRVPIEDDWPAICQADGRTFGITYTDESRELVRRLIDLSRYRIVVDDREIVGVAGSFAFDVSLPGGASVPIAGVTWVSVATTHRRQGILTRLMGAVHDDVDARGEPVATLYASESSIYERFGYGVGSHTRVTTIDTRSTSLRSHLRQPAGSVRFVAGDDAAAAVRELWWRGWRQRAGEVRRTEAHHALLFERRSKPEGTATVAHYLVHPDGYAAFRIAPEWNEAFARHDCTLQELVALTPEAYAALWQTLLDLDLVATISTRQLAIDEPLPFLLDNPRAVRTTNLFDGVWVNVRDVPVAFGARTYATEDRLVVEAGGRRWAIDGGPEGGSVRSVRTRPDVVTDLPSLGALLYGGARPSVLAAGRRLEARNDEALRRADLFFPTAIAPHAQTFY